jgi:hypothetical protein
LLVSLSKFRDFSQASFDPASKVVPIGLSQTQFIFVMLSDLCGSLREFGLEARPHSLVLTVVFALEQAESFFGGQLGDTSEVLDAEAIQNLCACEFACATAKRAFDGLVHRGRLSGHANLMALHFAPHGVGIRNKWKIRLVLGEIFGNTHSAFWTIFPRRPYTKIEGLNVTIRELIEEQRRRMNSANPRERLAAVLLIPGELTKRLDKLDDHEIGQLLDDEVGARLNVFAPESTVCDAAVTRLRRRAKGLSKRKGFRIRGRES